MTAVPFETDDATNQQMASLAGKFVGRARALDVVCDYSDASLAAAEGLGLRLAELLVRELDGAQRQDALDDLAFELGAYFGETFIRNHGGRWGWVNMAVDAVLGLRTNTGLTAFPLARATKRLAGDDEKSLVTLYQFLAVSTEPSAQGSS